MGRRTRLDISKKGPYTLPGIEQLLLGHDLVVLTLTIPPALSRLLGFGIECSRNSECGRHSKPPLACRLQR